jgi:hypothetical protein
MCVYLVTSQNCLMQDFLDTAEAVANHLSIQLENPSLDLDEQVSLCVI